MADQITSATRSDTKVLIVNAKKSVALGLILAFLFGPLGLLYSTILGGVVMMLVGFIAFFVLPIIGPMLAWLISLIWALVALMAYNGKVSQQYSAALKS